MTKACGVLLLSVAMGPIMAAGQNVSTASQQTAASVRVSKVVSSGWAQDESMLAKAIKIRAKRLEEKTGFRFDKDWTPNVSLEWSLGEGVNGFDGTYRSETQTVYFPIRVLNELAARHSPSLGCLNADTAAADDEIAELIDHELGHELMDQVSRRNGLGPWFTEARFNASTEAERFGLDILSEGTAQFFQRVDFPHNDRALSERAFPARREERRFYTYGMIAFEGGYWMVRDVLNAYGERGLVWLLSHPLVAGDDMRAAAVAYRDRALKELSRK